ncbi:MAG: hypothetical protein GX963_14995 [Bacteroidales bacterium]|nr:hypothetical protein [Bacteroidales bacterium]
MKNKIYFILFFLFLLCPKTQAQKANSGFNPNNLIFGGDIGFGISSSYWNANISPQIGYRLTNRFHLGAGISYLHNQSREDDYDYSENSVGLNLFAHYYPWQRIVLRVKPEIMRTWYSSEYNGKKESNDKFVPAVVIGAGLYFRPIMLLLNYELIQNRYSSYSKNVFVSVSFIF